MRFSLRKMNDFDVAASSVPTHGASFYRLAYHSRARLAGTLREEPHQGVIRLARKGKTRELAK